MLTRLKKLRNPVKDSFQDLNVNKFKKRVKPYKKEFNNNHIQNGISKKLLLVEPTNFYSNTETKGDNAFMKDILEKNLQSKAFNEFNEYIFLLKQHNIDHIVLRQKHPEAPDSIFPNNWFSTHKNENIPEGLLLIYPLKALSRRLEKSPEIIEILKKEYKHFVDLSYLENENEFLESTGSLIFDHNNKKIYCCFSERATKKAVSVFIENINKFSINPYELISFNAYDQKGNKVYHTNCMMSILEHHTIICLSSIKDESERSKIKSNIEKYRKIIEISHKQMQNFCGNVINVKDKEGNTVVLMSQRAKNTFTKRQLSTLSKSYKILYVNLETIEIVGGGSARCMVVELY